jgi:ribonucleotide monophosphatase NagD (HAD superfamily)
MNMMMEKYPDHTCKFIGKPFLPIYEYALSLLGDIPRNRICMIGDSLETDMQGAQNAGIGKVLVCSGNTREIPRGADIDFLLESLAPS